MSLLRFQQWWRCRFPFFFPTSQERVAPTPSSGPEKFILTEGSKSEQGFQLSIFCNPRKIVIHGVETCSSCQKSLADIPVSKRAIRQVKDIPQPQIEVTEHQVETKICSYGCVNTGLFQKGVTAPVQYGERISALAVYLSVQQLIPEDRLQTLFSDVFDLNIATATLVGIHERFAETVSGQVDATLAELKVSEVKHLDETLFQNV